MPREADAKAVRFDEGRSKIRRHETGTTGGSFPITQCCYNYIVLPRAVTRSPKKETAS